jgi:hypothetical protein
LDSLIKRSHQQSKSIDQTGKTMYIKTISQTPNEVTRVYHTIYEVSLEASDRETYRVNDISFYWDDPASTKLTIQNDGLYEVRGKSFVIRPKEVETTAIESSPFSILVEEISDM